MAKYLINSDDIEIEEVPGTQNLKLNFASQNNIISNFKLLNATGIANNNNEIEISFSYPTGFSQNNTFILDAQIKVNNSLFKDRLPLYYYDNNGNITGSASCILYSSDISIYCKAPLFSEGTQLECWVLIMKYEE